MEAIDLIRNKLSSIIENDRIILETIEQTIMEKQTVSEGKIIEQEKVIGNIIISVDITSFINLFSEILEDDVTFPNNKLQAMLDAEYKDVENNVIDLGYKRYFQTWLDNGIDF